VNQHPTKQRQPVPHRLDGLPDWGDEDATLAEHVLVWWDREKLRFQTRTEKEDRGLRKRRDDAEDALKSAKWDVESLETRLDMHCRALRTLLGHVPDPRAGHHSTETALAAYEHAKQCLHLVKLFAAAFSRIRNAALSRAGELPRTKNAKKLMDALLWKRWKNHPDLVHFGQVKNFWWAKSPYSKLAKQNYEGTHRAERAASKRAARAALTDEQRAEQSRLRAERRRAKKRRARTAVQMDALLENLGI
jgi:hypothetical protein